MNDLSSTSLIRLISFFTYDTHVALYPPRETKESVETNDVFKSRDRHEVFKTPLKFLYIHESEMGSGYPSFKPPSPWTRRLNLILWVH